jgi:hypothetical protein
MRFCCSIRRKRRLGSSGEEREGVNEVEARAVDDGERNDLPQLHDAPGQARETAMPESQVGELGKPFERGCGGLEIERRAAIERDGLERYDARRSVDGSEVLALAQDEVPELAHRRDVVREGDERFSRRRTGAEIEGVRLHESIVVIRRTNEQASSSARLRGPAGRFNRPERLATRVPLRPR